MKKMIISTLITVLLLASSIASANAFAIGEGMLNNTKLLTLVQNSDQAELPVWSIDDFWEYDLYIKIIGLMEIKVLRMEMKVIEITSDEYTLGIFGYVDYLKVSGYNYFQFIPSKSASGLAYVDKETLAMKSFSLSLEGDVKDLYNVLDINFDIEFFMEFESNLDFLDFPISYGDAWNLETVIDFSINANVIVNGENTPFEYNFLDIEINEELSVVAEEEISVPAGDFNSFKISSQNFETWYSSEIGYLAKLSGSFPLDIGKFECSLDGLISTNFNYPENNAPSLPSFDGPTQVTAGEEHDYTLSTIDPNGDEVYYIVDWGDGTIDDWFGPYASGEEVVLSHTFDKQAEYKCRAKAKDEKYQSCWTDPFKVTAPVNLPESSQSQQSTMMQPMQQIILRGLPTNN